MATEVSIIIKGKEVASEAFDKVRGQFLKLQSDFHKISGGLQRTAMQFAGALGVGFSVSKIVSFGKAAITAYEQMEEKENRLAAAMKNRGIYTEESYKELLKFADEKSVTSTRSEEEILSIEKTLLQYGFYGKALRDTTNAILNMGASEDDLGAITRKVAVTITSNSNSLKRLGIDAHGAAGSNEKLNSVLSQVSARFGGEEQAKLDSYSGKLKNLANKTERASEDLGKALIPFKLFATEAAKSITIWAAAIAHYIATDEIAKRQELWEKKHEAYRKKIKEMRPEEYAEPGSGKKGGVVTPETGEEYSKKQGDDILAAAAKLAHQYADLEKKGYERSKQLFDDFLKLKKRGLELQEEGKALAKLIYKEDAETTAIRIEYLREYNIVLSETAANELRLTRIKTHQIEVYMSAVGTMISGMGQLAAAVKADAELQRGLALFEITIRTAAGIMKCFEMGGPVGFITGAGVLATGLAEAIKVQTAAFAGGTRFAPSGGAMVGERGMEYMQMPAGASVYNNTQTRNMITNNNNAPVVLVVQNDRNIEAVLNRATRNRSINWRRTLAMGGVKI